MYLKPKDWTTLGYPFERHLPLQALGVIEEDELRCPKMLNADGERCPIVIKNGLTTGVRLGRATGIESFVREYFQDGTQSTSIEWAILPYDHKSGVFSTPGDSGAIIVDGKGCIGGLLIGGADETKYIDITYATPFYWILQRIQAQFPNAYVHLPPMA